MGFPNKKSFVLKIWELPSGEWTVYFMENEASSSYLFFEKAPSFGEVMMAALIGGHKILKETEEKENKK